MGSSASSASPLPDQWKDNAKGKTAIVTGSTAGLGLETVKALVRAGMHVVLAARNASKAAQVMQLVQESCEAEDDQMEFIQLDTSSINNAHVFADAFLAKHSRLHLLVLNAGIAATSGSHRDAAGMDTIVTTNYLTHFVLVHRLLHAMRIAAPARIITLTSVTAAIAKDVDWTEIADAPDVMATRDSSTRMYMWSKAACTALAVELQRRMHGTGVTAYAADPGIVATQMTSDIGWISKVISVAGKQPDQGAQAQVQLALDPAVGSAPYAGGQVFSANLHEKPLKGLPADKIWREKVWNDTTVLTGLAVNPGWTGMQEDMLLEHDVPLSPRAA